jgi:nitrate reductase NapAB chaperone NapD
MKAKDCLLLPAKPIMLSWVWLIWRRAPSCGAYAAESRRGQLVVVVERQHAGQPEYTYGERYQYHSRRIIRWDHT